MTQIPVILDDIVFSLQKAGGGSVYWRNLLQSCIDDQQIDLTTLDRSDSFDNSCYKEIDFSSSLRVFSDLPLRVDEIRAIKVANEAIFHSSFYRYGVGEKCINVTTVHDFICMKQYSGFLKAFSFWQIQRAVKHSNALIVISDSTKQDLLGYIPEASSLPIKVIPQGFSDIFSYRDVPRKNQVVFVGARSQAYKNFDKAVKAVACTNDTSLAIIGAPLAEGERTLLEKYLPNRYMNYVFPSSAQMSEIFNESIALLYLSEYEGFGIPPLEAMASGLPVIALNKSSIPEVVADSAVLFDEAMPLEISQVIDRLKEDRDFFNEYVEKGLYRSQSFSWAKTVSLTKEFYKELWESRR